MDSNHRLLDPQSSALTRLRYAPEKCARIITARFVQRKMKLDMLIPDSIKRLFCFRQDCEDLNI